LDPAVIAQTIKRLETNTLRSMDAIHIGSPVVVQADVFVSVDQRQLDAAAVGGLRVDDDQTIFSVASLQAAAIARG
jgi:hypothetical protein